MKRKLVLALIVSMPLILTAQTQNQNNSNNGPDSVRSCTGGCH
jgi:hypothetical protein